MKKSTWIFASLFSFLMNPVKLLAQDKKPSTSTLLNNYLHLKNALVKSDASAAAQAAAILQSGAGNFNAAQMPAAEQQAFSQAKAGLLAGTKEIAGSKDIDRQRLAFQSISAVMITFFKTSNPGTTIYIDYCPMKKVSWISEEKSIRNPYYGNSMLTCGKITETLPGDR